MTYLELRLKRLLIAEFFTVSRTEKARNGGDF